MDHLASAELKAVKAVTKLSVVTARFASFLWSPRFSRIRSRICCDGAPSAATIRAVASVIISSSELLSGSRLAAKMASVMESASSFTLVMTVAVAEALADAEVDVDVEEGAEIDPDVGADAEEEDPVEVTADAVADVGLEAEDPEDSKEEDSRDSEEAVTESEELKEFSADEEVRSADVSDSLEAAAVLEASEEIEDSLEAE